MQNLDDWELVARGQAGDRGAFAELVRRYQGPVIAFCRRMTLSQQDAEDLAQEAFVRLYRHLHRLEPKAKFSTMLFGIARNLTLNHIRDAQRRGQPFAQSLDVQPLAAEAAEQPDEQARRQEIAVFLDQAIASLSPAHREIIVLREIQGLDYASIARILKCRKGTVRSRLARAREQLRSRVEHYGGALL